MTLSSLSLCLALGAKDRILSQQARGGRAAAV